jgi:GWxTD domain-containing protein
LFKYWATKNPNDPKTTYEAYMTIVNAIDKMYNTGFGYGFETDRGYVYLKYGRPDDMQTFSNDAVAPPYEVWQYNDFPLTGQKNVKFLFYNQTLVANDFRILHSNARGEISNPRWKTVLYGGARDQQVGNSIDGTEMKDNFGRNVGRILEEF